MKTLSTRLPAALTESKVARYVDLQLQAIASLKNGSQIADEAGFPQRNLLSMIRSGQTKLPFERIPGLAKAMGVEPTHLFRIALAEYQPAIQAMLDASKVRIVTPHESQLLDAWREGSGETDPPVEPVDYEVRAVAGLARSIEFPENA